MLKGDLMEWLVPACTVGSFVILVLALLDVVNL